MIAVPVRQRNHTGWCAKTLEPAIQSPQQCGQPQQVGHPHTEIGAGRKQQTGSKEATDMCVIGEETIGELAQGVAIKQRRTDNAQLFRRKDASVHQRFFHHVQCQSADVSQSVTQRDNHDHIAATAMKLAINR